MIRFARTTIIRPAPMPSGAARRACRTVLVERMAEDMREMAFAGENVSTEALKLRGYSPVVIEALLADATAQARRLSIRHIEAA